MFLAHPERWGWASTLDAQAHGEVSGFDRDLVNLDRLPPPEQQADKKSQSTPIPCSTEGAECSISSAGVGLAGAGGEKKRVAAKPGLVASVGCHSADDHTGYGTNRQASQPTVPMGGASDLGVVD